MEKKKSNKKMFLIIGISILLLAVISFTIYFFINKNKKDISNTETKKYNDIINRNEHTYGNTNEHNSNEGRIVTDDEYWYFAGETGIFKQKNTEVGMLNTTTELFSASSSYLNMYDNYIYFLNLSNNTIYRIDKNGNDRTEIKDNVKTFFIIDEYIYFNKNTEKGESLSGIYRMDINGENEELIVDYTVKKFRIYSNGLLFVVGDYLAYTDLNGENLKKVMEDVTDFKVTDKFILYADKVENDSIYALSIDNETNEMKTTKMSNTNDFTSDLTLNSFILNKDYFAIIPNANGYKDMVIFIPRDTQDKSVYYTTHLKLSRKDIRDFTVIDNHICIVYENGRTATIYTLNSDFKKIE